MVVPAATVSDAAVFARDSAAVGKEAGAAAEGTRSLSRRVTISRMFLRLTCGERSETCYASLYPLD
jgi:hypothetical protein